MRKRDLQLVYAVLDTDRGSTIVCVSDRTGLGFVATTEALVTLEDLGLVEVSRPLIGPRKIRRVA